MSDDIRDRPLWTINGPQTLAHPAPRMSAPMTGLREQDDRSEDLITAIQKKVAGVEESS